MRYTVEFFRIRPGDNAHATLARVSRLAPDIEEAKGQARALFETFDMPQEPDGLRILSEDGEEIFAWKPGEP